VSFEQRALNVSVPDRSYSSENDDNDAPAFSPGAYMLGRLREQSKE
jgi:hypothetical protein